jgi:hypothetical protein
VIREIRAKVYISLGDLSSLTLRDPLCSLKSWLTKSHVFCVCRSFKRSMPPHGEFCLRRLLKSPPARRMGFVLN